jgi:hypothetical protein
MMRSKLRSVLVCVSALAICLAAVSGATARVIPQITTTFTQDVVVPTGTSGATTIIAQNDGKLGAHDDFTADITFGFGATGLVNKVENPATYPAGSDWRETPKDLVVDIPDGLVGNPNAIPYDQRCDISQFETSYCPESATVGELKVKISIIGLTGSHSPLPLVFFGPATASTDLDDPSEAYTRVSLLKTDPEVPAKIGVFVHSPLNFSATRTVLGISPKTEDGLKLRTLTLTELPTIVQNGNYGPTEAGYNQPIRIDRMLLKLYGKLPNGHNFMTNPTKCEVWGTHLWANATYVNDVVDADPLGTGTNDYKAAPTSNVTPDCTNATSVPFPITGNVAISSPGRDTSPSFDFTVSDPGVQGDGQVSSTPRRITTTIPASINVDVQQLGRTCPQANFYANTCPSTSKVGSVKIETPLISAGLSGSVYLVKRDAKSGLPDLGLYVTGAITFTQLGTNRYVGEKNNQIETNFDNIPQVGFTKLTFHLDGGPQGLLRSLACPTYNKAPALPTFTYNFFSYSGASATSTTPLNLSNCFGIQTLKPYAKCIHQILPIHPNYQSRTRVKQTKLTIDGKTKATTRHTPFRFDIPLKKLKLKTKSKHTLVLKATYDDGTISKKTTTFKVCK